MIKKLKLSLMICASVSASMVHAGGVIGGGGNIPVDERVTLDDLNDIIFHDGRATVFAYYNFLANPDFDHPQIPDLAARAKNIGNLIREAHIETPRSAPCIDPVSGSEADASAEVGSPPRVCFSLSRLQTKLSRSNAGPQVLALAVHEFSHLMGYDEAEADRIQKIGLGNLITVATEQASELFNRTFNRFSSLVLLSDSILSSARISESDLVKLDMEMQNLAPPAATIPFAPLSQWTRDDLIELSRCKDLLSGLSENDSLNPLQLRTMREFNHCVSELQMHLLF